MSDGALKEINFTEDKLTLDNFAASFETTTAKAANYFAAAVIIGDTVVPELIINKKVNFDSKLAYYKGAYGDDLHLKTAPHIRIVGWAFGSDLEEIQDTLEIAKIL